MKLTKSSLYLILIFLLALVLRIIAAHHTGVSTDEMVYSVIPYNIISSGALSTNEQGPLFFYLTDLGYKLLGGVNAISVRLVSIVFGSLACLVIFLISQEIFKNKKASLLSAFLFAVSSFAITFNYEMDMLAFFFALLSILFFIKFLKGKHYFLIFTSLFLALGSLAKPLILTLVLPFLLIFLIYLKQKKLLSTKRINKNLLTSLIVSIIVALLIVSPVLIYNFLSYQEKGVTDYYFASVLGIGNYPVGGSGQHWETSRLIGVVSHIFTFMLTKDVILSIFGLVGGIFLFKKNKTIFALLWLSILVLLLYVGGKVNSSPHYLLVPAILSIFAGYPLLRFSKILSQKIKFKQVILLLLATSFFLSFFSLQEIVESRDESITLVLRDFVKENIADEGLVIIDPRIYNGIHAWVFHDKHYIQAFDFFNLLENQQTASRIDVPIYYLECGPGTNCGWKPEDFQRIFQASEEVSNFFKERTTKIAEVQATHNFRVYYGELSLPKTVLPLIDQTHNFWGYSVGWKYPQFSLDYYSRGFLHYVGLLVLWLDILLTLGTILLVFRMVLKETVA